MKIPDGYTEQEVLQIIERISNKLAGTFKFGYYELDDIKQEAALFAWEGLTNYDGIRPLENFLWVHVRNRLCNLKRNNYFRPDIPCDKCPFDAFIKNQCTLYENMMDCDLYAKAFIRKETKKTLMSTKQYDDIASSDNSSDHQAFSREIYDLIDKNISPHMREDWIRFCNKLKLSKIKRESLLTQIFTILGDHGIQP